MSAPAGWYPDESAPGSMRWWDGQQWTNTVQAAPETNAQPSEAQETQVADPGPPVERFERDPALLHRKAQDALTKTLMPGEEVRVIIRGPSAQAVIGTDRRAFVYKKGFMAGASFGSEMTSWTYTQIVGVQLHTGMMSGAVVVQAPGQSGKSTSYWRNDDDDPYKAPNAIPVVRPYGAVEAGVAQLRELIDQAHRHVQMPVAPTAAVPAAAIADEVRKLAEMRRDGLTSEEEFAEMKAHIMSR